MSDKVFRVSGSMLFQRHKAPFTQEVLGEDEDAIREKVLSRIGSRHKLRRESIRIDSIDEIARDDVSDPNLIQYLDAL